MIEHSGKTPKQMAEEFKRAMQELPVQIGAEAENFFKDNFKKQAWQGDEGDEAWKPWAPSTAKQKKSGDKILVKHGFLYRGINKNVQGFRIKVSVSGPAEAYADIHNEGGTIRHPGSHRKLSFSRRGNGIRFASETGRRKIVAQSKSNGQPYDIKIPKRKFIGNSKQLDRKLSALIVKRLNKVFNN